MTHNRTADLSNSMSCVVLLFLFVDDLLCTRVSTPTDDGRRIKKSSRRFVMFVLWCSGSGPAHRVAHIFEYKGANGLEGEGGGGL